MRSAEESGWKIETLEKMMAELQRMRALQASTLDIS
jgi:hypothetical protein